MQLRYEKQKQNISKQRVPILLACLALLLGIAIMTVWLLISYRQSKPPTPDSSTDAPSQYVEPLTDVDSSLIILDFDSDTRFILVQTDPADNAARIMALPANLADENGNTLSSLLNKHGPMKVVNTVSTVLDLSVKHHVTWSADGVGEFLNELSSGIVYVLPEDLAYTDENGATIRLKAGEQKLTGAQAAAVLRYRDWSNTAYALQAPAEITAAVLNQYLLPGQRLDGYFAALADTAQTDLRIDNYNSFRPVLAHLSNNNDGSLCQNIRAVGTEENGVFKLDLSAMKKTELYP